MSYYNCHIFVSPHNKTQIEKAMTKLRSMGAEWQNGIPSSVSLGDISCLWKRGNRLLYSDETRSRTFLNERARVGHSVEIFIGCESEVEE